MINILISFKVSFNQSFLIYSGNLVASEKFLGSGMKCDTSKPNYPKVVNVFFTYFTTSLKTLCKPLPILFAESYSHFRSLCFCIIRSRIFNLAYPALMSGCTYFPSQISSRSFVLIDP